MKKKHRKPFNKAKARSEYSQLLRRTQTMSWTQVQLEANVVTFEANPMLSGGQTGMILAKKTVTFVGYGDDVDTATEMAHKQLHEFLSSDAMKIGTDMEGPAGRRVMPATLAPINKRPQ